MKKLFNYLIATALMAFTFTSCEDVPSPFGDIVKPDSGGEEVVIEPSGDGTEANPYNVAGVLEFISGLGADTPSTKDVYVKGIITEITEKFGTQYGNATFIMSDTESGANKFTFYRGLYIGNVKYSKDTDTNIKEGDVVVICGKVVNYKGNTPETSQGGAYVVSINGQGGGTTPPTPTETLGTKDDPITVTKALEYINALADNASTAQDAYVAGKITKIKTTDANVQQYHNIDYIISDGTNELTVFRGKNLDNTDFNSASDIAVGDEVVVFGKLTKYVNGGNTTPEVAQGNYIVKITKGSGGGGGDTPTPSGTGDGSENNPYSVSAAIAKVEQAGVFVKAYIVGWVEGQVYTSGAHFDSNSSSATNILIAESATETNPEKCMPVQLPAGDIRNALNLKDNPGNYKKEVILYGDIIKYFGVPGLKNTSYAKIGSTEIGTKPGGGGDQPGGGDTPGGTTSNAYMPVTTIANGNYVFAATVDGKVFVATPLEASKTYGYLGKSETTLSGGGIETDAANEFKFTAVDGGYTIQSPDGRYLYMKGTYNSFNVDATAPSEGHVWTVTFGSNNSVSIKNVLTGKTIQYSTQFNSYGAYTDVTNVLPVLYKK